MSLCTLYTILINVASNSNIQKKSFRSSFRTSYYWCSILKIVRTHFAAAGGEEAPRKNERLRREPDNFKFLNDLSINHSGKFFNKK